MVFAQLMSPTRTSMISSKLIYSLFILMILFQNSDTQIDSLAPTIKNVIDFMISASNHSSSVPSVTADLIHHHGFHAQEYLVTTKDGYILKLTRILGRNTIHGIPVLMQHGLFCTSDSWLLRGRHHDLAFLLADAGFDVWLSDQRGNANSKQHILYHWRNEKFWDFSFHESAIHDLPAFIDHILLVTGYKQLFYIGHSMGTTVFQVLNSVLPEYNSKFIAGILLAPVSIMPPVNEVRSGLLKVLLMNQHLIYSTIRRIIGSELMPRNPHLMHLIQRFCGPSPAQNLCLETVGQFYGYNKWNWDLERIGYYLSHFLAGSSANTVFHLAQLYSDDPSGTFRMFDYGYTENFKRYHSHVPPLYNLTRINAPVAIFSGYNDVLMTPRTVKKIVKSLPNVIFFKEVPDRGFTHMDFIIGLNSKAMVYDDVLSILNKMSTI